MGTQKLYDQDTWNEDPFTRWSDDPTSTWIGECNFRDFLYLLDSFDVDLTIYGQSLATFSIWDEDAVWNYTPGQVVEIRDADYDLLFGGVIDNVEIERIKGPVNHIVHQLSCIDWTWIADKRLLFMAVANQYAGDIVNTIYDTILIDEGITIGEIQQGALIAEFRASYSSITEALDSLAESSDFIWIITENKKLYFVAPATYTASAPLEDADILEDTYNYTFGNTQYRNRQYVLAGQGRTSLLTESFAGDGQTRVYKTSRPVALVPTITINAAVKTVGIGQVDTGKDFYWNADSDSITQDSNGTILTKDDVLQVVYYGLYKIVTATSDFAAIADRSILDGTTGIVEAVVSGSGLTTASAAIAAATAKLTRFSRDATKFDFQTVLNTLACGQMLPIEFSAFDFAVSYLITNIKIAEDEGGPVYSVTCCDGPVNSEWEDVFKDIHIEAKTGKIDIGVINDSDVLVFKGFTKTWNIDDRPNPFHSGVVADDELPGDQWIPGFAPADRWKYIVVYRANVEIFRKAVLSVEYGVDVDYASCYLTATEAVGDISHIGLWGGEQCTAVAGSGIGLDKQTYTRTKTNLESLQVVFSENKGW